jgi:cytochrome c oxidase assembly factor CtaG
MAGRIIVSDWNFDPIEICAVLAVGALYARRARTLGARGLPVPRLRLVSFAVGLLVVAAALVSPIDTIGEERLFSVHMLQHLMLGDIGALLLVLGLDGRLLQPLLRWRVLYRLRFVGHPCVALPLWAANFCVWHVPTLMDAALRNDGWHALQHSLFIACGMLMWAALVEPLPGPAWFSAPSKILYVLAMWVVMLVLSQVFIWSGHPFYIRYGLDDQKAGGGVMLVESIFTMLPALVWVLLRVLRESEARQKLLDAGVAPRAAARAARYGRG